jgi:hypothetical protein
VSLLIVILANVSIIGAFAIQYKIVSAVIRERTKKETEDELIEWWAKNNNEFSLWANRRYIQILDEQLDQVSQNLWNKNS